MDISVVIVNYRTEEPLLVCLQHLVKNLDRCGLTHEVFVVDNDSTARKIQPIASTFAQVYWICNAQNEGFAKACNQGLQLARGTYVMMLNPDASLSTTSIGQLVKRMDEDPRIGIASGRHLFPDGRLQPTCRSFPTLWNVFTDQMLLNRLFPNSPWFNGYKMGGFGHSSIRAVDQLMGSCLMLRQEMLRQIGFLDERFFLYFEEVDLCWRAKKAGWKIIFFPDAEIEITHVGGASSRQELTLRTVQRCKSLCLWYRKHQSPSAVIALKVIVLGGLLLRLILSGLIGQPKGQCRAYLEALMQWPRW